MSKKNPKQTVENIIAISTGLFVEKGYDKTSMQDIVDALGMSKGAIFHHFKSKEDILDAVISRHSKESMAMVRQWICEMEGLCAKEKISALFERVLTDPQLNLLNKALGSQALSPHMIVAGMQENVNIAAPMLAKLFREGVGDGSIATQFPDECAQVFFLLFGIWCDHVLFACDAQGLCKRILFLQQLMQQMGADIISDKLVGQCMQYIEDYYKEA